MTTSHGDRDEGVADLGLTPLRVEDLIGSDALGELAQSFHRLTGVAVRVFSPTGAVLSGHAPEARVHRVVRERPAGPTIVEAALDELKRTAIDALDAVLYADVTGVVYRIVPLVYEDRPIARIVLGPYLSGSVDEAVEVLRRTDPGLSPHDARDALSETVVLSEERAAALSTHIHAALDLILFSGHKALMTSRMHLASVEASYRELMQKNEELQHAYERLQELDRLKSSFLATISHELRTPLTSIIGYSEMLAEGMAGPLAPEQLEFIQTIRNKGDQLLGLIMSLLDLSKLESGTLLMRRDNTALEPILVEALSSVAPQASKKGVRLRLDPVADLPRIRADADRLRQVFVNLVDNAVKFTPPGGEVHVSAAVTDASDGLDEGEDGLGLVLVAPLKRCVEVRVSDSGVGVPSEERERVFDPFYQVDQSSTREQGGTGLGLSIVKRIVEAHLGEVSVRDNEPRGAVFVVRLPISSTSSPPQARSSTRPPHAHAASGRP